MSEQQSLLYLKFEEDVPEPIVKKATRVSVYEPLIKAILGAKRSMDNRSPWMRFLFAERRVATKACGALRKINVTQWHAMGLNSNFKVINAEKKPQAWLYVQIEPLPLEGGEDEPRR